MIPFQQKILDILSSHAPVWIVGGAIRDSLLGREAKDIDAVTLLELEQAELLLREQGFTPHRIGTSFQTLSLFEGGRRIDIVHIDNVESDALKRDFTINAIYKNVKTQEIIDPLAGRKDLKEKILKACGSPEKRFQEDPVRILRMVKLAVKYDLEIENETWEKGLELVSKLGEVPAERITAELAGILILDNAEQGIRLLDKLGYWEVFVPELARLKGLVQNRYHSLDVWEHTMAVVRGTPPELFIRLAALFHDLGKWEVASHECYVKGKLVKTSDDYEVEGYKIWGTKSRSELTKKLEPYVGQDVKILGSSLDHYPQIVQFKRVVSTAQFWERGLEYVQDGKRHFLNHEKESAKLLKKILKRFTFTMFFEGQGKQREKDLLALVENHMRGTLLFMPEFRGENSRKSLRDKAAELVWEICWKGRSFELQRIYDFLLLWRADFFAGKVHSDQEENVFENVFKTIIEAALWQNENLNRIDWKEFRRFASEKKLEGKIYGKFKDFVRKKAMTELNINIDRIFLNKALYEFIERNKDMEAEIK